MATTSEVIQELEKRGAVCCIGDDRVGKTHFMWSANGNVRCESVALLPHEQSSQVVDQMWPESVARDVPEGVRSVVCTHMPPDCRWNQVERVAGNRNHYRVTLPLTEDECRVFHNEIRKYIPAHVCIDVVSGIEPMNLPRPESAKYTLDTLTGQYLDTWAEFIGIAPRRHLEQDEAFRARISAAWSDIGAAPKSPETTVAPDQTDDFAEADYRRMVERVVTEKDWTELYGTPAPPFLKEGLRPPEYMPMSPHGYREVQRFLNQNDLARIKIFHPGTETVEQPTSSEWASEQSNSVEDIQHILHHDRRKNARPTPAGIASLIRDGIAPHEYPQREGKIELGVRDECRCILCTLPRGKSWGEVELQRRIEWMGQQVHESLHAVGVWIHRGRTRADRAARHTDPSLGMPFDVVVDKYRKDLPKGPLFSQRQKGSTNGK